MKTEYIDELRKGLDMRKSKDQREYVLRYLEANDGNCSVFWITDSDARASAMCHLQNTGEVVRIDKAEHFPHCKYKVCRIDKS